MSKQPEALRLADALTPPTLPESTTTIPAQWSPQPRDRWNAVAELRRQHALIEELREALLEFPEAPNPFTYRLAHKKARAALAKAEAQS
jgi:hypothetical protein